MPDRATAGETVGNTAPIREQANVQIHRDTWAFQARDTLTGIAGTATQGPDERAWRRLT